MVSELDIEALQRFSEALKADPAILFTPELSFLKDTLSIYGNLKLPSKTAAPKDHGHCHDHHSHTHDHSHSHEHGHSHSANDDGCCEPERTRSTTVESCAEEDDDVEEEEADEERMLPDPEPYLSVPSGGEDWDGSSSAKEQAAEAKGNGQYELAVEKYTEALTLGQVSALTLANRAECLLKLKKPMAAISDCTEALLLNPDSAKALRCRGRAYRYLGKWEKANLDIAAAQRIDYDPEVETLQKFVSAHVAKLEAKKCLKRNKAEKEAREKLQKRRAEIEESQRKAREEAARRAKEEEGDEEPGMEGFGAGAGAFPGMAGMGGSAGMQQMLLQMLMSDPELKDGLQNPKIMAAFSSMMSGGSPSSLNDPEVSAFLEKLKKKMGPLMGMMGGAGGMGGMGTSQQRNANAEDIGDDEDLPDLVD